MAGEIATAWVTLMPSFKGGSAAISRELDPSLAAAGASGGKKFSGAFGGVMKGFGATLLAGMGIGVISDALGGLVGGASDLNETVSKANTIFGENSGAIQKWAEDSAFNLGLPKQAALDLAANFGNMFQQLGFSGDQALTMSEGVAQLSADLGSFNNLPTSDVADRISAAFRGEYDSLQLLIPNINAARVEQEAMAATGKTNAKELTAQEKAAAVLAIVQKDGAAAMGDFARTSDGAANKGKILSARWADLKSTLGQKLLPAFSGLLDFGGKILDFFTSAGDESSKFGGFMSAAGQVIGAVFGGIRDFIVSNQATWKAWWAGIQGIFSALQTLVMTVVGFIMQFWRSHGDMIMSTIRTVWETVKTVISSALAIVQGIIRTVIALITGDWSGAWEAIKGVLSAAWDGIVAIIEGAWAIIGALWETALSLLSSVWSVAWDGIKSALGAAWDWITSTIDGAWEDIKSAISGAIETVKGWLSSAWESIKSTAQTGWENLRATIVMKGAEIIGWVSELPGKIVGFFIDLGSDLYTAGRNVIQRLWDGLKSLWESVSGWFTDKVEWITGLWPFSPAKHGPLRKHPPQTWGENVGRMLADGLRSQTDAVQGSAESLAAAMFAGGDMSGRLTLQATMAGMRGPRSSRAGTADTRPVYVNAQFHDHYPVRRQGPADPIAAALELARSGVLEAAIGGRVVVEAP